ncbi:MAG: HD domain-containing phosphohydrolase [Candidatus Gastranaerophilaceae bacterium]|nr:HD domain-containing phosphohydrolase [Candidatus Gastranaerophilaceae bacterium]
MLFSVNRFPYFGSVAPLAPVNTQPQDNRGIKFKNQYDSFESTNPKRYTTEQSIRRLSENNHELQKILKSAGIEYRLNMEDLGKTLDGHCSDTVNIAEGIVRNLPFALETKADLNAIRDAAYLHDIGKVFIPTEILNKNGKLDENETEIVHKHAELGYELLKNTNINPKTLQLIRNHHQNAQKTGYPKVDKNFYADLDLQILSIADKYSALTEERPYKKPLTREQALTIIRPDVRKGKINPLVYNALVNYTDEVALNKEALKQAG